MAVDEMALAIFCCVKSFVNLQAGDQKTNNSQDSKSSKTNNKKANQQSVVKTQARHIKKQARQIQN